MLDETKRFEANVDGLQSLIKIGLTNLMEIKDSKRRSPWIIIRRLKQFRSICAKKVELPSGTLLLNCYCNKSHVKCSVTCLYPCSSINDGETVDYMAMYHSLPNHWCTVCPKQIYADIAFDPAIKMGVCIRKTAENILIRLITLWTGPYVASLRMCRLRTACFPNPAPSTFPTRTCRHVVQSRDI